MLLLGLGLGEADRGDLRLAVRDARDAGLVDHRRREPRDVLGQEDALGEAAVRELQAGHDVAERVHVLEVRAQPLVGEHEAALHRHTGLLEAGVGRVGAAADGDEQVVGLDLLARLQRHGDRVVGLRGPGELHPGLEGDLAAAERALERLRRELVLVGDQPGERLDHRDLGTEALEHAGQLDADHPATEHDDARGTSSRRMASLLVMIRPPISRPGNVLA